MDQHPRGFSDLTRGGTWPRFCTPVLNQTVVPGNTDQDQDFSSQLSIDMLPSRNVIREEYSPEAFDYSDLVLSFIDEKLTEEYIEDQTCMLHESLDLQEIEKSFYDGRCKTYTPEPEISTSNIYSSYPTCINDINRDKEDNCNTYYNTCSTSHFPCSSTSVSGTSQPSCASSRNKFFAVNSQLFAQLNGEPKAVEVSPVESKRRKNSPRKDEDEQEERNTKELMTDRRLLYSQGEGQFQNKTRREALLRGAKNNRGGKGPSMKHGGGKEVVNIMNLLSTCAQALAADDRRSAYELMKQIRQHSSPLGDGNQRLAHYFVDCLEARLVGTGSKMYKTLSRETSAIDILKAYHLHLTVSPFVRIANFVTIKTIVDLVKNSRKLHVIDFGIYHGFQWHILIQRLSLRHGGPPVLRITGIEFPKPGFKPAEHVEDTGRRLAEYAASFHVPFMFNAIAKKWEDIQVQDLQIDSDEIVVVNSSHRFENLSDEIVTDESPRDIVLKFVRKLKPDIFLHRIINGAYGSPFFVTRSREVLFHFSALFDMLEATVPREDPNRYLIERHIYGRIILNVIACEGSDRVEKPELYRHWKLRNIRAGFKQVPFDQKIVDKAIEHVKLCYHKEFSIAEDTKWLLQGWKGRMMYVISAWKA